MDFFVTLLQKSTWIRSGKHRGWNERWNWKKAAWIRAEAQAKRKRTSACNTEGGNGIGRNETTKRVVSNDEKNEILGQVSSRGSVPSASGSFRFRQVKTSSWVNSQENKFDSHLEETHDDKPSFSKFDKPPWTSKSKQADAKMNCLATQNPSTLPMDGKHKKSLKFDAKVFLPSVAYAGAVKAALSTPGAPLTLLFGSTPAMLPPVSVSIKLVLDKFDGNPLKWPERSGQILGKVDGSGASDSNKMQYLKTLVTGKATAAIECMRYSGQMKHVAWQTLEHDFSRPELVVNAQLRKIHANSFIKPHDALETVKYSQVVSGCVNVLTQFAYEMDIGSESMLNSVVRKLPKDLKNKCLTYLQRYDASHKSMRVFSAWLKNIVQVRKNMRLQFGSTSDKARTNFTGDKTKSTSFAATSDSSSPTNPQCSLKDGEHTKSNLAVREVEENDAGRTPWKRE